MSNESKSSRLSVDWERFGEFLFQFVAGIGLGIFWLVLLAFTISVLIWCGVLIHTLPFAWILGVLALVPVAIFVWWLCFHVALDGLSDIGITLQGIWSWLVIPIAPVLALFSFIFMYVSGVGKLVTEPIAAWFAFGLGIVLLLSVVLIFVLRS